MRRLNFTKNQLVNYIHNYVEQVKEKKGSDTSFCEGTVLMEKIASKHKVLILEELRTFLEYLKIELLTLQDVKSISEDDFMPIMEVMY